MRWQRWNIDNLSDNDREHFGVAMPEALLCQLPRTPSYQLPSSIQHPRGEYPNKTVLLNYFYIFRTTRLTAIISLYIYNAEFLKRLLIAFHESSQTVSFAFYYNFSEFPL